MSLLADQTTQRTSVDVSTLRGQLEPALADLPTRQRQVLSLRYLAGLDDIEVSEALGISTKAVRRYAAQGIAGLRAREVIRENLLAG
jgi:RNA polymerase sigma factor (sigma-70 family)